MVNSIIKSTTSNDIAGLTTVLDETKLFPSEMLSEMLAPALERTPDAFWLTCHHCGEAVGLCYTTPEEMAGGTWNMLALAVRPDLQGNRLGSALVSAAEQRLKDKRQRILIVETSGKDDFTRARKFYTRKGFEEEARIRDFWADGDDKVIFRKAL